jgi:hypothetical protein
MVPMHARRRKGALHELPPRFRATADGRNGPLTPTLSPSEGEREDRRQSLRQSDAGPRFMVPMHARRRKGAFQEPKADSLIVDPRATPHPSPLPLGRGEGGSHAVFSAIGRSSSTTAGRDYMRYGLNRKAVRELFSEANLTERDKLRPLANYGRINGRRRAPDGSRSCLPAPGRKRARGVRSDRRRQGRLVPVPTK